VWPTPNTGRPHPERPGYIDGSAATSETALRSLDPSVRNGQVHRSSGMSAGPTMYTPQPHGAKPEEKFTAVGVGPTLGLSHDSANSVIVRDARALAMEWIDAVRFRGGMGMIFCRWPRCVCELELLGDVMAL